MSLFFEKELAELRAQGIGVADLTADEIERLVRACDKMANPFSFGNIEAAGFAFEFANGLRFYKMTIGATCWLDEFAGKWWKTASKQYFWAMVYALVNARNPEAFTSLTNEAEAHEAIAKFGLSLTLSEEELLDGIERAIPTRHEKRGNAPTNATKPVDWANIIQTMEAATGLSSDVWVWKHSADWAVACYNRHHASIRAMSGAKVPRLKDELDYATNELAHIRAEIIARVKSEKGADE